jgi:hypothetical protein
VVNKECIEVEELNYSYNRIYQRQIEDFVIKSINSRSKSEDTNPQDLLTYDFDLPYNYKQEICALILLEDFSAYEQTFSSIKLNDKKESVDLTLLLIGPHNRQFHLELRMNIIDSKTKSLDSMDYKGALNSKFEKDFFRKFIVQRVLFEFIIPIVPLNRFNLKFHSKKNSKCSFFSNIEKPYPIDVYSHDIRIDFQDSSGKECQVNLFNPPILLTKQEDKFFKSGYIPSCVVPVDFYLLTVLEKFDFSGIEYLSDINSSSNDKNSSTMTYCDNERSCFFISGIISTDRNYDRYKVFKVDINFLAKKSNIEEHGFEDKYFDD